LIRLWCWFNTVQQDRVARRSLVLVNSETLAERMRPHAGVLQQVRTTTFSMGDLFQREDTCQTAVPRLVFSGRLDVQKGLEDIVRAMAALKDRGLATELSIVGWEDSHDPILAKIVALANQLGLGQAVNYLGFKPAGDPLFQVYRQSDIFVSASRAWEGFPRTIWEAMSQSLPVVATRVGAIPRALADGRDALLAAPRDPGDLANRIEQVIRDGRLRRSLIASGSHLAQRCTLEETSRQLVQHLREWFDVKDRRWQG
jgi:glycosyltransferase involved in cell wall biosynthesis